MSKNTHPLAGIDAKNPESLQAHLTALFAKNRALYGDAQMNAGDGGTGGNEGGSGEGGEGTGGASTGLNPDGSQKTAEQIAAEAGEGSGAGKTTEWDGEISSLPAGAQKIISDLRTEAADKRTKAGAQEQENAALVNQFKELGKLLGVVKEEDGTKPPTLEELTSRLTERDTENETLKAELKNIKIESALKSSLEAAKASKLTIAVLKGEGKLTDLDPSEEGFQAKLDALVKETIKNNPELKLAQAAGKGGVDLSGQSGGGQITKAQFDAMSGVQKNALFVTNESEFMRLSAL